MHLLPGAPAFDEAAKGLGVKKFVGKNYARSFEVKRVTDAKGNGVCERVIDPL
jgi:hypothetical protein